MHPTSKSNCFSTSLGPSISTRTMWIKKNRYCHWRVSSWTAIITTSPTFRDRFSRTKMTRCLDSWSLKDPRIRLSKIWCKRSHNSTMRSFTIWISLLITCCSLTVLLLKTSQRPLGPYKVALCWRELSCGLRSSMQLRSIEKCQLKNNCLKMNSWSFQDST